MGVSARARAIKLAVDLWPMICELEAAVGFPVSDQRFADELSKRSIRCGRWNPEKAGYILAWSRFGERLGFLSRD